MDVVNLIESNDWCMLLALISILAVVGSKLAADQPRLQTWGWRLAAAAFVIYALHAVTHTDQPNPEELVSIALRGLLAGGLTVVTSWIALGVLAFAFDQSVGALARRTRTVLAEQRRRAEEHRQEADECRRQEEARAAAEEARRQEEERLRHRPKPPTNAELRAAAKERYAATLRFLETAGLDVIELQAAREQAKQRYLQELDRCL